MRDYEKPSFFGEIIISYYKDPYFSQPGVSQATDLQEISKKSGPLYTVKASVLLFSQIFQNMRPHFGESKTCWIQRYLQLPDPRVHLGPDKNLSIE